MVFPIHLVFTFVIRCAQTRDFREIVHKNTFEGRGVDWQAVRQELDRQHILMDLSIRSLEDRYNDGAPEPKDYSWTEANRVSCEERVGSFELFCPWG